MYVAGPYSAEKPSDRVRNVQRAMQAGHVIIAKGHWPYVPHWTHYFDDYHEWKYGYRLEPEEYMQWDFVILRRCDALLFLQSSPGADRELALARELGLPVFMDIDEVPPA